MKRGYIKLWRKIWSNDFWKEKRKFSRLEAWLDMLLLAQGKEKYVLFDGKKILVERGQLLTSQRILSKRWNWSKTKTGKFLNMLQQEKPEKKDRKRDHEKDHSILIKSDRKKSIITVLNYSLYNPLAEEKKTTENLRKKTTEKTTDWDILNNEERKLLIRNSKREEEKIIEEEREEIRKELKEKEFILSRAIEKSQSPFKINLLSDNIKSLKKKLKVLNSNFKG